jgi:hypothetical protein
VKDGSQFERRPVQIGISDYAYAEVQHGLSDGEVVALETPSEIKPDKPAKPSRQVVDTNAIGSRPTTAVQAPGRKAVL